LADPAIRDRIRGSIKYEYREAEYEYETNRIAESRGSALECASIHDILCVCDALDDESSGRGKLDLRRIVSMLTWLIQRSETVSEGSIEYEYRDAEYEYETNLIAESWRTNVCNGAGGRVGFVINASRAGPLMRDDYEVVGLASGSGW
jgi:hypothetical protein